MSDELHAAVCNAVSILNMAPEVARHAEGRQVRDILRQALIDYADAALAAAQPPAAQADSIVEAWLLGRAVQYLVLGGHDDEWTDFSGGGKPNTGSKRLAWRLKPTPQAQSVPATGAQPLALDVIREAKQDAMEVFDAEGPETPQIVRDVIEYMASWLEVYAHKRASPTAPTGSAG